MIDSSHLNSSFVQYGNTCILGSYAIASNFYTKTPILNFFKDYCKHYDINTNRINITKHLYQWHQLSTLNRYEVAYDSHFHDEYKRRNIPGLMLIKKLHDTSCQKSFVLSRGYFNLQYIPDVKKIKNEIENDLEKNVSSLLVSFKGDIGGRHIAVIGCDNNGVYMIETRPTNNTGVIYLPSIFSLTDPGDAILTMKVS